MSQYYEIAGYHNVRWHIDCLIQHGDVISSCQEGIGKADVTQLAHIDVLVHEACIQHAVASNRRIPER